MVGPRTLLLLFFISFVVNNEMDERENLPDREKTKKKIVCIRHKHKKKGRDVERERERNGAGCNQSAPRSPRRRPTHVAHAYNNIPP